MEYNIRKTKESTLEDGTNSEFSEDSQKMKDVDLFLSFFPGSKIFATLDEKKQGGNPKHFHENKINSRAKIMEDLNSLNDKKHGVFFTPNNLDPEKDPTRFRTGKMWVSSRAIWVDDDIPRDKPRTDFPIEPNVIVNTSKGKFHYYWLTKTHNKELWRGVMKGMVINHGCDRNAIDPARILRLPLFDHCKKEPYKVTFTVLRKTPYEWTEILKFFPPEYPTSKKSKSGNSTDDRERNRFDINSARDSIIKGTNYHGAIVWLMNHYVNKGLPTHEVLLLITDVLSKSEEKDSRWCERSGELYLEKNLKDCIEFVGRNPVGGSSEVNIDSLPNISTVKSEKNKLCFPPGKMGLLCQEIQEMSLYPNSEISITAGFALAAGICGRKYNVNGMGLNIYLVLLADSGMGKSAIKDVINHVLMNWCKDINGMSFIGQSRFTGPKPIFTMLEEGGSRICVMEEAGLISQSKAGDQAGITRALLDLYTSSGAGQHAGGEGYSSRESSIPVVESPALSTVSISTPKALIHALKEKAAQQSGEIARMWMLRIDGKKPYANLDRKKKFSDDLLKVIRGLVSKCTDMQLQKSDGKVIDLKFDREVFQKDANDWVDKENHYLTIGDALKRTVASRAWAKALKIAGICSVVNGLDHIGKLEYTWALNTVKKELESLLGAFEHESSEDISSIVKNTVGVSVIKLLKNGYTRTKTTPANYLLKKGIFTKTIINQIFKNNPVVTDLDDNPSRQNPKKGIEKILKFMTDQGYLEYLDAKAMSVENCQSKIGYKITPDFELFMTAGDG